MPAPFITLTFVTLLVFELVTDARVHYVQYALIGAALTMFYLPPLALSEHVGLVRRTIAASTVVRTITSCVGQRWVVGSGRCGRCDADGDVCGVIRDSAARGYR